MQNTQIDLLALATICGAIGTIWGVVAKVITPIRNMLKQYDNSLSEANKKLAEMDNIIEQHKKEIKDSKTDREKLRRAVQALLRFTLYSECLRAGNRGHRSNGAAKDLEPIYQSYQEMGLNGLGKKVYLDYLELPTEDD